MWVIPLSLSLTWPGPCGAKRSKKGKLEDRPELLWKSLIFSYFTILHHQKKSGSRKDETRKSRSKWASSGRNCTHITSSVRKRSEIPATYSVVFIRERKMPGPLRVQWDSPPPSSPACLKTRETLAKRCWPCTSRKGELGLAKQLRKTGKICNYYIFMAFCESFKTDRYQAKLALKEVEQRVADTKCSMMAVFFEYQGLVSILVMGILYIYIIYI